MGDLLKDGAVFLESMRHKHMSQEVTYVRGADSVALNATIGEAVFEQENEFGVVKRIETRDFLVRTQDLVIGGSRITPAVGDKIKEAHAFQVGSSAIVGATLVYEVLSLAGQSPWRYSDQERQTIRVHTKYVGEE